MTFEMCDENSIDADGNEMTVEQWLELRKQAGRKIDPATAIAGRFYTYTCDPYMVWKDIPGSMQQVGSEWFARSADSDIWVSFQDIPLEVQTVIWSRTQTTVRPLSPAPPLLRRVKISPE